MFNFLDFFKSSAAVTVAEADDVETRVRLCLGDAADFVSVHRHVDPDEPVRFVVMFDIKAEVPMALGDELNDLNEDAYMNGANWKRLLLYYLKANAPLLLEQMSLPEAGDFVAVYDAEADSGALNKAVMLARTIGALVTDRETLRILVKEEGSNIDWA